MTDAKAEIVLVQPGLYRHYKGGLYTVLGTVRHHATGLPMVRYVSHDHLTETVRPLVGWEGDPDGFFDYLVHEGLRVPRFAFLREPDL